MAGRGFDPRRLHFRTFDVRTCRVATRGVVLTPVATGAQGRNYFRVEARLDRRLQALRPGMEGIAKITIESRPLLWIWTHDLIDWLRLWAWSWWP